MLALSMVKIWVYVCVYVAYVSNAVRTSHNSTEELTLSHEANDKAASQSVPSPGVAGYSVPSHPNLGWLYSTISDRNHRMDPLDSSRASYATLYPSASISTAPRPDGGTQSIENVSHRSLRWLLSAISNRWILSSPDNFLPSLRWLYSAISGRHQPYGLGDPSQASAGDDVRSPLIGEDSVDSIIDSIDKHPSLRWLLPATSNRLRSAEAPLANDIRHSSDAPHSLQPPFSHVNFFEDGRLRSNAKFHSLSGPWMEDRKTSMFIFDEENVALPEKQSFMSTLPFWRELPKTTEEVRKHIADDVTSGYGSRGKRGAAKNRGEGARRSDIEDVEQSVPQKKSEQNDKRNAEAAEDERVLFERNEWEDTQTLEGDGYAS